MKEIGHFSIEQTKRAIRFLNFHFSEDGRTIYRFAKEREKYQLKQGMNKEVVEKQTLEIIEEGKKLIAARSIKNIPNGIRYTATSVLVGQAFCWGIAPVLANHIHYNPNSFTSSLGAFLIGGGSDKLFLTDPENPWIHTSTINTMLAKNLAAKIGATTTIGMLALGVELSLDFARAYISEYWSQKKYGIVPDGLAAAYGQDRPIAVRFSTFEVYQKILGYVFNPISFIGTQNQIFTSIQGSLGSLWRMFPQMGIVATAGPWIDKKLEGFSKKTGLRTYADAFETKYAEIENESLERIDEIVGVQDAVVLEIMREKERETFFKLNPFKPSLTYEDALKIHFQIKTLD